MTTFKAKEKNGLTEKFKWDVKLVLKTFLFTNLESGIRLILVSKLLLNIDGLILIGFHLISGGGEQTG